MKKLLDSKFLFIIALSLIVLLMLGVLAFYMYRESDTSFLRSGYVLNPLSAKVEKYYFEKDTDYRENLSSMIEFKDVDKNEVAILKESFLHYDNNDLSFLKDGAILDLGSVKGKDAVKFYNITKEYIKKKYNKPGNVYLGLVHRLDRPVEGIMVFAKTSKAASRLQEQIKNNNFQKTYYAVVNGIPKKTGEFTDYLVKDEATNTSKVTNKDKGKIAKLTYETINTIDNLSLVKIKLLTGRHHQIRVEFSHHGYPLYGDHKYNKEFINDNKTNIALIAKELSFYHPTTKELLHFEITLPDRYPYNLFK